MIGFMNNYEVMNNKMSEKVNYCKICRLYWFWDNENEVSFRLTIFAPIKVELCPWCSDPSKEVPKVLEDFRKKK